MVPGMSAPRTNAAPRHALVRTLLVALAGMLLLVACGSSGTPQASGGTTTAGKLLDYQRVWPDGRIESQSIFTDGKIVMKHGESLERLVIEPADVARIQDALKQPIPTGSPDDSPKRTLTLPDGTVIQAPRPEPGSVTDLLEQLLDTHVLS